MTDESVVDAEESTESSVSDIELSEEQKNGIEAAKRWYIAFRNKEAGVKSTFTLSGPAGSGKSTIGRFLIEELGLNLETDVVTIAPTGKAANVMRQKGMYGSRTAHSVLYTPLDEADEAINTMRARLNILRVAIIKAKSEAEKKTLRDESDLLMANLKHLQEFGADNSLQWLLNPASIIRDAKLVLCDEGSMIGGRVQKDLESFEIPILYLGDGFQLPYIPARGEESLGSVFFDQHGKTRTPDYQLTQILRQAEDNPIIRYSRALRENRVDELRFTGVQRSASGTMIRTDGRVLRDDHYAKASVVICGRNDTRHNLNRVVRQALGRNDPYPVKGDKLIILKNNKEKNLFNGMTAIAASDYYDFNSKANTISVDCELEDGRNMKLNLLVAYFQAPGDQDVLQMTPAWSRASNIHADFGNAITCHKAQGSQYPNGIMINEPLGREAELRRRWEYTGLTRFSQSCITAL